MCKNRVAYLGPPGTFSEEAAVQFCRVAEIMVELVPYATIHDCAEAVENGEALYAVVPLENSLEGSVNATLDILSATDTLVICGELVLDIEHLLLAGDGELADIRKAYSHPQALAQCRPYLRRELPWAETVPVLSTADAAATAAANGRGTAAVGSRRAAARYGLKILAAGIQEDVNRTRFAVLTIRGEVFQKPHKTSVLFSVRNVAGSLLRVLEAFARHGVNMTRIESRPARRQLGDYIFFADLDGTPGEGRMKAALEGAADEAVMFRVLGVYPAYASTV